MSVNTSASVEGRIARQMARQVYWGEHDKNSHACCDCGTSVPLEVHHIDGNPFNNELNNLVALCHSCHTRRHRREKIEARLIEMREEVASLKK